MDNHLACEVCGSTGLEPVLDLGNHPMCDDLVKIGDTRVCREYPIFIVHCRECDTSFQRYNVTRTDLFPPDYHYRSRFTNDVLEGMKKLVASVEEHTGSLAGRLVLDVGCNDGSLLDIFARRGAKTIGIEPTGAADDAMGRQHDIFKGYFDVDSARRLLEQHGKPSIITFTNVFAHIDDLGRLLEALGLLIDERTILCIENHYLGSIIEKFQFDTFYHEHPRTYSLKSFETIARRLGLNLFHFDFPSRYGGNIRVMLGPQSASSAARSEMEKVYAVEAGYYKRLLGFSGAIDAWVRSSRRKLERLIAVEGKLYAKAFPGRAAILIKMLGLTNEHLAAVSEKPGSMKIGHYVPGTRIPVISDTELFALRPAPAVILNLAWHIGAEIRDYMRANGYTGDILDILDTNAAGH